VEVGQVGLIALEEDEDVVNVAKIERSREIGIERSGKSGLFPPTHEETSIVRRIDFPHGSAFDLQEPLAVEREVIAGEGDAKELENFKIWTRRIGVTDEEVMDGPETIMDVNHRVERLDVHGGHEGGSRNQIGRKTSFELNGVSDERGLDDGKRSEEVINKFFNANGFRRAATYNGPALWNEEGDEPGLRRFVDFGKRVKVTRSRIIRRREKVELLGRNEVAISQIGKNVRDENGSLREDGRIEGSVKEWIRELSKSFKLVIVSMHDDDGAAFVSILDDDGIVRFDEIESGRFRG
jgi:hypothetical protein